MKNIPDAHTLQLCRFLAEANFSEWVLDVVILA